MLSHTFPLHKLLSSFEFCCFVFRLCRAAYDHDDVIFSSVFCGSCGGRVQARRIAEKDDVLFVVVVVVVIVIAAENSIDDATHEFLDFFCSF